MVRYSFPHFHHHHSGLNTLKEPFDSLTLDVDLLSFAIVLLLRETSLRQVILLRMKQKQSVLLVLDFGLEQCRSLSHYESFTVRSCVARMVSGSGTSLGNSRGYGSQIWVATIIHSQVLVRCSVFVPVCGLGATRMATGLYKRSADDDCKLRSRAVTKEKQTHARHAQGLAFLSLLEVVAMAVVVDDSSSRT